MNNLIKENQELKGIIAKMLPNIVEAPAALFIWLTGHGGMVRDTEILHLCSLIEDSLTDAELNDYCSLWTLRERMLASWQEIVIKLAKVKGYDNE